MQRACSRCSAPNLASANFCRTCGYHISSLPALSDGPARQAEDLDHMGSSFSLGAAAVIFVAESYAAVGMVLAFDHLLLLVTLVAVLLVAAVLVLVDDCFQTIARSNRASARAFQLEETARDPA